MAVDYSPNVVTDNLVFYLDGANSRSYPGSGSSWFDLSGKLNTATHGVLPTYSTTNQGEFTYNGTTHYTWTATTLGFTGKTGPHTVEMFVKFGATPTTRQWLFLFGPLAIGSTHWLYNTNGTLSLGIYGAEQVGTVVPTPGVWMHLCVTTSKNGIYVYKNGKLYDVNLTSPNSLAMGTSPVTIAQGQAAEGYFAGSVANIKIYNKMLSAEEVAQNFAAHRGRFGL